ncbi:hypothetical protein HDU93_001969 [Gonapodya sp. JEL0774]|nr:hypothetical protein HDU93_001969 [Gonapodya sp. JEL0774]
MSHIYLRIKRNRTTYFVDALPTDTVAQLKAKLARVVGGGRTEKELKLSVVAPTTSGMPPPKEGAPKEYVVLEDGAVLEQVGFQLMLSADSIAEAYRIMPQDDSELFVTYWLADTSKWEEIDIPPFEALEDDGASGAGGGGGHAEKEKPDDKGKGKAR